MHHLLKNYGGFAGPGKKKELCNKYLYETSGNKKNYFERRSYLSKNYWLRATKKKSGYD